MSTDHYIECVDLDCPGCLPSDDDVRAMKVGEAKREAGHRGLRNVRAMDTVTAILDDADDYRARSAEARALLQ